MQQPTEPAEAGVAATTSARIIVERPPPGLARGKYAWPPWAIGTLGASVLLIGVCYYAWRLLRRKR